LISEQAHGEAFISSEPAPEFEGSSTSFVTDPQPDKNADIARQRMIALIVFACPILFSPIS
jgi:hypothetical protein|tara:strand:- start:92 stop:274 length:183 start_codon:yes stop_codon:yes gene_type:complete